MSRIKAGVPRKTKHISVVVTEEEYSICRRTADILQLSISDTLRMLLLDKYADLCKHIYDFSDSLFLVDKEVQ